MTARAEGAARELPEWARLVVELGPLVVFFLVNWRAGIFWATGVFMAATVVALAVSLALTRRVPVMPLVSGAFVVVFGALTLWLQDELFIKLKPTIVNLIFAGLLGAGLWFRRPLLKLAFGTVFRLDEAGWHALTLRWMGFFVLLAALNEIVWRSFSTDFWVSFKVFGIMPLTLAFSLAQLPLIQRHTIEDRIG